MWLSEAVKEVVIYKSTSTNVWRNLALEDWILQNVDLARRRILLLWKNSPVVVIGRHQNPWLECNLRFMRERNIVLARRQSGGGAVYHDLGNLNFTMFAHRTDYDRPRNLQLVCDALNERWGMSLKVNKKDDIICNDQWKVSGSAARLVKDSSFHHFTLLLHLDTPTLSSALKPHPLLTLSSSTATPSVRSEVMNLCTLHPEVTSDEVVRVIVEKFYELHDETEVVEVNLVRDDILAGLTKLQSDLQKMEWIFGKTPSFSLQSKIVVGGKAVDLRVEVGKGGIVTDCVLNSPVQGHSDICHLLQGRRWWREDIAAALQEPLSSGVEKDLCASILDLL